jgi:N-acetylglutamate synthase-like GNAT family acetyltransferase
MVKSKASLTITPELIESGDVLVAEYDGRVVGVASIAAIDESTFDLVHMFIEPDAIGTGSGRTLFENIATQAKSRGAKRLSILADPNAEAFYIRMGAQKIGIAPSDAIAGRFLPLLELEF